MIKGVLVFLLLLIQLDGLAQFSYKSFEISVMGGASTMWYVPEMSGPTGLEVEHYNVAMSTMYQLNDNIAFGPYLSRGQSAYLEEVSYTSFFERARIEGEQLTYGFNIRFATNRDRFLRTYINLGYYGMQIIKEFDEYNFAQRVSGPEVSTGLMMRLSNRWYWHTFDLKGRVINQDIFFVGGNSNSLFDFQLHTGFLYNFGKFK